MIQIYNYLIFFQFQSWAQQQSSMKFLKNKLENFKLMYFLKVLFTRSLQFVSVQAWMEQTFHSVQSSSLKLFFSFENALALSVCSTELQIFAPFEWSDFKKNSLDVLQGVNNHIFHP